MKESFSDMLSSEIRAIGNITDKTNPRLLIEIIHSLINKSRLLINSLETTLAKVEGLQKEATYWRHRYFTFK